MQAEAVLDIGSSKVVCMLGRSNEDGRFEIFGIGSSEHKGLKNKQFLDEPGFRTAVQQAVDMAQSEARRRIRSVHVGVPGPFVRTEYSVCEIELSDAPREITSPDIDQLMETAVQSAEPPEGYVRSFSVPYYYQVDGCPRSDIPMHQTGKTIWAAVSHMYIEQSFIEFMTNVLEEIGIAAESFTDAAFAEATMLIPDKKVREEAILVDVGRFHTDVVVMRNRACVFRSVLPVGGAQVASDITYVLSISPPIAEEVKQRHAFSLDYMDRQDTYRLTDGTVDTIIYEDIQDIIEARALEIGLMVRESILKSAVQIPPETILYFVGGGLAMMRGSKEFFQAATGYHTVCDMPWMPRKNTPNYASVYGMLYFVCNSALGREMRPSIKENRLVRAIINFFTK